MPTASAESSDLRQKVPTPNRKEIPAQRPVSISPDGEELAIPAAEDYGPELHVGFVGAVMAAVAADTVDAQGKPSKLVIGVQRPSTRSFWRIP